MKNAWKSILIIVVSAFVLFACMGSAMAHNYTLTEKHLPEPLAMKEIPNEPDPIEAIETYQIPEPSASEIPHVDFIFSSEECEETLIADGDPDSMIPLLRDFSFVMLTHSEADLLEAVAMAEAEGEDAKGKALVMRVVLNRSLAWGQSIEEVIYKPNQFAVSRMDIEPSEDCHEALAMIVDGWDESEGALYFNAGKYSRYGNPLFQHGGHYFSK